MTLSEISQTTIDYHEECVSKVKKYLEERRDVTVSRNGFFDILSKEEYDDTVPLCFRLSKLSADLKVIKNNQVWIYVEVKTEDIKNEQGNLKLNALQWAYFIHQFNQKGIPTMYSYFQRDGIEKGWWADDPGVVLHMPIVGGSIDALEYVESALKTVGNRRSMTYEWTAARIPKNRAAGSGYQANPVDNSTANYEYD
ncbi:MAG TPA: hypothetical protein VE130_09570 [Nitrososphaeraceae archaeon]|nr:hypothetical protein [Nitrososphaeraceae archaeon]